MLFEGGPKLNLKWITNSLFILIFIVSILIKHFKPLTWTQFVGLLFNLEGTVILASAFSPDIPPHGKGWWNNLKWAISEFHKHSSPVSFNFMKFYLGLLSILIGISLQYM